MLTIVTLSDVPAAVRKKTVGTADEWRAAGITPAQFRSLTRAGDLVRVRHGVYATRSAVESAAADPRQGHALRVAAARVAAPAGLLARSSPKANSLPASGSR